MIFARLAGRELGALLVSAVDELAITAPAVWRQMTRTSMQVAQGRRQPLDMLARPTKRCQRVQPSISINWQPLMFHCDIFAFSYPVSFEVRKLAEKGFQMSKFGGDGTVKKKITGCPSRRDHVTPLIVDTGCQVNYAFGEYLFIFYFILFGDSFLYTLIPEMGFKKGV